jgi:hypothetical protein
MSKTTGTIGDDHLTGTNSADRFGLQDGGSDTVVGLGGDDIFFLGGSLDQGERLCRRR